MGLHKKVRVESKLQPNLKKTSISIQQRMCSSRDRRMQEKQQQGHGERMAATRERTGFPARPPQKRAPSAGPDPGATWPDDTCTTWPSPPLALASPGPVSAPPRSSAAPGSRRFGHHLAAVYK